MLSLGTKAAIGMAMLAAVMGAILFLSAGTFVFWQGWNYLIVFFASSGVLTAYLARRDPALLARRLSGGPTAEKEPIQRLIMALISLCFIAMLIIPGVEFRLHGSRVPVAVVLLGDLLTIIGWWIIYLVYRENTFSSATIEIAKDQQVISTGPYAIVRHPMYSGGFLYLLGAPLGLGSYWDLIPVALIGAGIVWRLLDEERFLTRNLAGYDDYRSRLRWRLVPGIY